MQIVKTKQGFHVLLFELERMILEQILRVIIFNYGMPPDQIDERVRRLWYDADGLLDQDFEHEREYWEDHLRGMRSERGEMVKEWLQSLEKLSGESPSIWNLPEEQGETFLMVLNDHRLCLAALSDIQENDMDSDFMEMPEGPKKEALAKIEFLGVLQELMMRTSSGS